ncbi:hypothetical protein O181_015677 [Austropuccinia psidii MF-1]|uniref:Uncharacterized protein n=1 Tax=Austropuccinia psidii MF-1 TaxID=1389203 RepID=A0A9Q3GQZ4_9BASI|nr:hypothetical protein [Austropuccinia psidii MF-1]
MWIDIIDSCSGELHIQEALELGKKLKKNVNEPLGMDFIKKIGHNEIVEVTTPVLITCHDGKCRLFGDFRALSNYTKADRYPIPRIYMP